MIGSMAMIELRLQIYNFIISYKEQHDGNSPSIREIGTAVGDNSTSHVRYLLDLLVSSGLVRFIPETARSIEVVGSRWVSPDECEKNTLKGIEVLDDIR